MQLKDMEPVVKKIYTGLEEGHLLGASAPSAEPSSFRPTLPAMPAAITRPIGSRFPVTAI